MFRPARTGCRAGHFNTLLNLVLDRRTGPQPTPTKPRCAPTLLHPPFPYRVTDEWFDPADFGASVQPSMGSAGRGNCSALHAAQRQSKAQVFSLGLPRTVRLKRAWEPRQLWRAIGRRESSVGTRGGR
jgi:hypothetical protein